MQPIITGVPAPVEVTRRTKGDVDHFFILNHAADPVTVSPGAGYEDALEGGAAAASFGLKPYEYRVLKKATTAR